jgi:PTS system cellobiose-specific IIA component
MLSLYFRIKHEGWRSARLSGGGEMSKEEVAEIAMQVIASAGEARSKIYDALNMCLKKDFEKCEELISEAEELIIEANKLTYNILSAEAKGENISITLLLIHAFDILMASIIERDLAKKIIQMLKSC